MPWLLLPYATTTQALSATTAQVIHGSQPYLTFDNGVTKVTTTESLLDIKLSDGTRFTPATNTSTATNPIVLPVANQRFTDIDMLVPSNTNSIALNSLIGAPYNYWGDDDGDGQGTNGITITGNLNVRITDNDNQDVSRSTKLDICKAPYKVVLTTTNGNLTTRYGMPNSSSFTGSSTTYYFNPKSPAPVICYARPVYYDNAATGDFAGPANIWNPYKGYLVQSSYSRNFPTTGANSLYFDLIIGGSGPLTWPTVTKGGITATMTSIRGEPNNIRVTFTGPTRSTPSLPQQFELVGYDSSNRAKLKYGFVLRQWFVQYGTYLDGTIAQHTSWCSSIGYRLSKVKDLTNAVCSSIDSDLGCQGAVGGTPSSTYNGLRRSIGAGLYAEWGGAAPNMTAGFGYNYFWTSDSYNSRYFRVYAGRVLGYKIDNIGTEPHDRAICVYP